MKSMDQYYDYCFANLHTQDWISYVTKEAKVAIGRWKKGETGKAPTILKLGSRIGYGLQVELLRCNEPIATDRDLVYPLADRILQTIAERLTASEFFKERGEVLVQLRLNMADETLMYIGNPDGPLHLFSNYGIFMEEGFDACAARF